MVCLYFFLRLWTDRDVSHCVSRLRPLGRVQESSSFQHPPLATIRGELDEDRPGPVRLRLAHTISEMSIGGVMHITWFNVTSTPFTTSSSASSVSPERRTEFRREYCSSSSCWNSMASTFFGRVSIRPLLFYSNVGAQFNSFRRCQNLCIFHMFSANSTR